MSWRSIRIRLRSLLRPSRVEDDLAGELATHLDLQIRKYQEQGLSDEEARRRARIDFGTLDPIREQCRDIDRWRWIDSSRRSCAYALRLLRRSPAFTAIAVLILAVAFGANLAVFNLLDAVLFRPLPVQDAGSLVHISIRNQDGRLDSAFSTLLDPLRRVADFRGVCGFNSSYEAVEAGGLVTSVGIEALSGDCFETLGIRTELGRAITMADDHAGTEPMVVITDWFWRSALGGRRSALGQRIRIENQLYTIAGITEPRFTGLLVGFPAGVLMPLHQQSDKLPGGGKARYFWVNLLARLAPGVSRQEAAIRLKVRQRQLLEASVPPNFKAQRTRAYLAGTLSLESGRSGIDYFLRARFGEYLYAMAGVCGCLLLIGCVNLSSLLLARGLRRRREIAVRFALGASRAHVAGIFVVEALILTATAAVAGILLAQALDARVVSECAKLFSNFDLRLAINSRALLFVLASAGCSAAAFSAASIWQAERIRLSPDLREEGRGIVGAHSRSQSVLIGVQIALTLTLVAASGLLSSSLKRLDSIDLGFATQNVEDVMLSPRPDAQTMFASPAYYRDLLARVGTIPGVTSAALADFIPLYTRMPDEPVAAVDGDLAGHEFPASVLAASPTVFDTLGIRLVAGEPFRPVGQEGEPAAILSESLARRFGSGQALVGRHVRIGTDPRYRDLTVVGVASNTEMSLANPDEHAPYIAWVDIWQHPDRQGYPVLLLRTAGAVTIDSVRRVVDSRGPLFVDRVHTLESEKDGALMENRLLAWLSGCFALMALAMAAIGLFGILSYQVTMRTSEIGVRMALGAGRAQIRSLISRQTLKLVAAGCASGVLVSLAAGRALAGLLYGVSPYDPLLLLSACAVLLFAALAAAWLPAQRAASVDPLTALRHD